ncbi:MAG: hypothetical protein SFW63_08620 [Alphaproteobacteria bacterium]|nr:hypothetical protein [Alphaproteobacteria bacterium]
MMRRLFVVSSLVCGMSLPAFAQQTPSDWQPGTGTIYGAGSSAQSNASIEALAALAPAAGGQSQQDAPTVVRARDGEVIESLGGDAIPALPLTVMSNGTMKYVTGGVGQEELSQLKSLEKDFNVQLLIAGTKGTFMGDATVRVVDTKDTVLFTVENAGPYFYLYLPPADYILEVTSADGNLRSLKVKAPASGATKPVVRF